MVHTTASLIGITLVLAPLLIYAQGVPADYREEVRAVLLSGRIDTDITESQFEDFVDALSEEAYNANVTGAEITSARAEALLSAAAGFDQPQQNTNTIREPKVGILWGTVALLLLMLIVGRYYRRMHQGGGLGHV